MAMTMTDCHRNVCQVLLDQGVITESALIDAFGEVLDRYKPEAKRARLSLKGEEDKDRKTLQTVVETCNGGLEPLGLKIARMRHKDSSASDEDSAWNTYYGVVNLVEDDAKQDWMSKSEQEFFHKLVIEILDSEGKHLESQEAIAIGRDLEATTKLSASDANNYLDRLTRAQWLAKSDDGYYSLGVRTELQRRYLKSDAYQPPTE